MANLNVRLPDAVQTIWSLHCLSQGTKPSTVVRDWIVSQVQEKYPTKPATTKQTRRDEDMQRQELLLTDSEMNGIQGRIDAYGGTRRSYIVSLIRADLAQEPTFTDDAVKALNEATYELRAMNTNLRNIVKSMKDVVSAETLTMLDKGTKDAANKTETVCKHVHKVLDSYLDRWSIKS